MKYPFSLSIFVLFFLVSCSNLQSQNSKTNLSASEFSEKIKQLSDALIVDVRTPEEFEKGHLVNAKNIDWNNDNFDSEIAYLDKTKPVFVYCLSGGRSSSAANKMRNDGFKEVYELKGGIMKWRAAKLPETTKNSNAGMSKAQFDALLDGDKLVLIDFYADWCVPCKKMKPFLEEISKEQEDKLILIRINADDNQALCKELKIDALPVLQLYKNKSLLWNHQGFIEKNEILKALEEQASK
ncbi:MAG: thioredoxin [Bacteroidetes bacterium]|nr:thioredoxin [Bacteroidota bacterium]